MKLEFGARSDTGRTRENNEDSFASDLELNLFVLSDGMGGLAAGEVASKVACETVIRRCRKVASASPAFISSCSRATTGAGVPAGAKKPSQDDISNPGMVSPTVGTSGNAA